MYSVEDGERGGDMPRLYSFTIGRRNRDAAVQSVRVAATRQPQTALEQSEKAYLYSLVVSSAGYREGQPPTATLVTTCFLCGTLSASSLSSGWPIATQVIPTGRVAYTPSAYIYIYIQIYYDASLLLERPGSPSAGAQPARASCNFFFSFFFFLRIGWCCCDGHQRETHRCMGKKRRRRRRRRAKREKRRPSLIVRGYTPSSFFFFFFLSWVSRPVVVR